MEILLINDDEIAVFGMKRLITREFPEAQILSFPNGLEAINYLENCSNNTLEIPSIIFLDLNMPIMDSW
jgi:CheY-like chemotaxis protein